jgi:hypothetical protein
MPGRLLDPADHPKKEVREILVRLVKEGWTVRQAGHWGTLYCPCLPPCTRITVGGTPENPGRTAPRIANEAARCPLDQDDPRRPPGTVVI